MHTRDVLTAQDLLHRVQGEFLEMPGLRLTEPQAQRLWGLDEPTCASILEMLVLNGFLTRAADGRYTRASDGSLPPISLRMAKVDSSDSRKTVRSRTASF